MAIPPPLTTAWTPAPACLTDLYIEPSGAVLLGSRSGCNPPGFKNQALTTDFYYSPGIYCPASYSPVYQSTETVGTVTETRAICCPNADLNPQLSGSSFSLEISTDQPFYSSYGCVLRYSTLVDRANFTYTWTSPSVSTQTTSEKSWHGVNAYSVQIRWQASDLVTTTTSVLQPMSSTSPISASTPLQTSASNAPNLDNGKSPVRGLSTTAKIAIGVIVPVIVLAGSTIIAVLLVRRRKKKRQAVNNTPNISNARGETSLHEISGTVWKGHEKGREDHRFELDADNR